jgi:uncharacterized protein
MHIKSIVLYPIKSCKGIEIEKSYVDARGLVDDRSLMVIFENGKMLTQRDRPQLALVQPMLGEPETLLLSAPEQEPMSLKLRAAGNERTITVWNHATTAVDQGDEVGKWFSDFLGTSCRLVRIGQLFERSVEFDNEVAQVSFADHSPMVIATQESLEYLNQHLCEPMMISRFRANIVLAGSASHDEYKWDQVRIGDVTFQVVKDCARCVITCVDQETGGKGKEPLRTLVAVGQRSDNKAVFGIHAMPLNFGEVRLDSEITVTAARESERVSIP